MQPAPPRTSTSPRSSPPRRMSADEFGDMFHRCMNAYVARLKRDSREHQLAAKRYNSPLIPRMDLQEFGGPNPCVHAYLELPGMEKEDIVVSIPPGAGVITVFGERKGTFGRFDSVIEADPLSKPGVAIREIKTGKFRRDIPAPTWLCEGQVTAVVSDGVLHMSWPLGQNNTLRAVHLQAPSTSNHAHGPLSSSNGTGLPQGDQRLRADSNTGSDLPAGRLSRFSEDSSFSSTAEERHRNPAKIEEE